MKPFPETIDDPRMAEIPMHTRQSILDYVNHHIPIGSFLEAVFTNDLMHAFGRADEKNRAALFEICSYIYNHTPHDCHGSHKIVNHWLKETVVEETLEGTPRRRNHLMYCSKNPQF